MSTASELRISPLEYLKRERAADQRSEYFQGQAFAMAGASPNHNRLVRNILSHLDAQLRGTPCEVFPSDLRLSCPSGLMTYPDAQVICGPLEYRIGTDDTVTNPKLIVEVLSKLTESYDRGQKFAFYREIPTLQQYVMVGWQAPLVERFQRHSDGWLLTEARGLDAVLPLPLIGCSLPLSEVYRDIVFSMHSPELFRGVE